MNRNTLSWFKSSYSAQETNCVEVAFAGGQTHVRDTKDRRGGTFACPSDAWSAFVGVLKRDG